MSSPRSEGRSTASSDCGPTLRTRRKSSEADATLDPELVARAARSDAPVLIVGEPGSGRSSLAREIHRRSARATAPLVEIDPGAIPAALLESELFGYRAGAFTGAERAMAGRVERAAGGTLVLDHVGELPLASQPKLLRLVAERLYAPLGGTEQQADVRFVAVGDEDLEERTRRAAYRQDLFYRLAVIVFRLPPLRERRNELPAIVAEMLSDLGQRFGRPDLSLADEAWPWFARHSWPGNLRELRNTLERALIHGDDARLAPPAPPEVASVAPRSLREVEEEAIRRALAYTRGRQGDAARLLGISRKALWEKRKRFGLP
jgi:DNA-binding NtrC family response regulator